MFPKSKIFLLSVSIFLWVMILHFQMQAESEERLAGEQYAVRLNEVCSRNFSVSQAEDGEYYDYIELYNPTDREISLEGLGLSRGINDKKKFVFGNKTIAPNGYMLVYAAGEEKTDDGEYAAFKLSSRGETVFLTDNEGKMIDSVEVPANLPYNTSYARWKDGDGNWERREATPGYTNEEAETVLQESLDSPVFSAESGFYDEPFLLELKASKTERIFYTLDGSKPTMDSILYTEPIVIEDVSANENVYSARTDLSAAFFAEEGRFAVPAEKVDKAVIVRAAAFAEDGSVKSKTETKTYFVGYDSKEYEPFAFISLVTEPDNLFGYETGIYVSGKTFDDFVESGELAAKRNPENWRRWLGNYSNRGKEWERPVHIDFFDASQNLVLTQEAGIRIKGGTSRSFTQKSLGLYARDIYSGTDEFQVPFFGENGRRRVTLFSGAQDYRTKIQDALLNTLLRDRAFCTMESYPCYVFLDGEYWGVYHVMETYGEDYLKERYGVPKGEAVIVRNGNIDSDTPGSGDYVNEFMSMTKSDALIDAEEYEKINALIDMRSYLDYYAAEIYINRGEEDWPVANEGYWRTAEDLGGAYTDGKWRYMLFDTNWACLNSPDENTIAYTKERSVFFDRLCQNETFREQFVTTMCDLMNTTFRLENVAPVFTGLAQQMRDPAVKDLKKYYGDSRTEEDFDKEILSMAEFFQERPAYMAQLLKEEFELTGTLENVTVNCTEGGTVRFNTVDVPAAGAFSGQYFTDYPVTLLAVPEEGFHFAGWSGDIVSEDISLEAEVKPGGIAVWAVFEKD